MKPGRVRDSQRSKLYAAEKAAYRWTHGELDPRFDVGSIEGAQKIVEAVWASQTILNEYVGTRARNVPLVVPAHGKRLNGCYQPDTNEIHLCREAGLKWYVLHEAAHALVPGTSTRAWHGREFAACYLHLVRVYMGRGWSEVLEREFKNHGVAFKPKRAYTISDDERQRRVARAANLRA